MARPKSREYDALTATEKEAIVSLYKGCADQKEQIKICAELHSTTVGVVRRVLEEAGQEVPPHPGHRAAVANKESEKKVERTAPPPPTVRRFRVSRIFSARYAQAMAATCGSPIALLRSNSASRSWMSILRGWW